MYIIGIYTFLILSYIASRIFPSDILSYSVGIIAVLALVISLRKASVLYLKTGLIFLLFGCFLFIYHQLPWYTFFLHFESMLGLLSFFYLLPFIQSLIRTGHFDTHLNRLIYLNTTRLSKLYFKSSLVSHMLGIFLNVAAIPVLIRSLDLSLRDIPDEIKNRFYTSSILRAFALCLTWSPLEALVGIAIDATGVQYASVFLITFLTAILFILASWIVFTRSTNMELPKPTVQLYGSKVNLLQKKIVHFLMILVMFAITVSLVNSITGFGFLFSIVLVAVPFSLVTAVFMKKIKQYLTIAIPLWRSRVEGLSDYFFMFLSAGFFVEMISQTKWVLGLRLFLVDAAYYSRLIFYLFVGIYFLVASLAGFHQLVSLVLLLRILDPVIGQLEPIPFTLVLISCSIVSAMYSPYSVSVSLMASEIRVSPYRITRWNLGFASCYMLFCIVLAYFLGFFM